jgi:hypothetical protein
MNNSIKLLLFTFLSLAPCATEAMGALCNLRIAGKTVLQKISQKQVMQLHAAIHPQNNQLARYIDKNNRLIRQLRACPALQQHVISGSWKSLHNKQQHLLPLFEQLKQRMGNVSAVPLVSAHIPDSVAEMHDCLVCDHKAIIIDEALCRERGIATQKFLLAHELAHASLNHGKKIASVRNAPQHEVTQLHHAIEYEADAEAVRVLGTLDGAVEFFGHAHETTPPDAVSLHATSTTLHPSDQKRAAHLISIQKLGQLYFK